MVEPRLVGSRYELGELIGYGGMAEVHRGRDVRLGRDVAIKVLRADLARDPSFLNRFRREAQAAAGLNHPSIVSVYDTGEDDGPDGVTQPYIVMEFVSGRTLRDILKTEGRLPARRVMEIGADISAALDFSHRNGIVHRDIKPANVMITQTGAVKVMDFGIARAVADNSATVTQTANVIGTAQYLSPEQARGESVDARSDVYSTGCLLYELATGSPPFQGDSPVAIAYQHVRENPTPPSSRNTEVPPALDSVIMKSLAKNPLNRYQSAGEMRTDLQRALANQPVVAEAVMSDAEKTQFIARTPAPAPIPRRLISDEPEEPDGHRRSGLIWLAVVLAMLLVIGGIAGFLVFTNKNDDNGPVKKTIPQSVIGQKPADVIGQLKGMGFTDVRPGTETSGQCFGGTSVDKGLTCLVEYGDQGQDAIGVPLEESVPVFVRAFTPERKTVPFVIGLQLNDASDKIVQAGLKPVPKKVNKGGTPNEVIDQDPKQYADVAPGTEVTLTYSTGKANLPDVSGLPVAEAQSKINAAGFTNITAPNLVDITHEKKLDGTVKEQNPVKGAYATDTQVTLTVWNYEPECTTPPPASSSPPPSTSASNTGTPTDTATPQGVVAPAAAPTSETPTDTPAGSTSNQPDDGDGTPTC
jgi:serine/threonine-protein kinase